MIVINDQSIIPSTNPEFNKNAITESEKITQCKFMFTYNIHILIK